MISIAPAATLADARRCRSLGSSARSATANPSPRRGRGASSRPIAGIILDAIRNSHSESVHARTHAFAGSVRRRETPPPRGCRRGLIAESVVEYVAVVDWYSARGSGLKAAAVYRMVISMVKERAHPR
jgi:hypothetical protein